MVRNTTARVPRAASVPSTRDEYSGGIPSFMRTPSRTVHEKLV
jgi:hypothetical protein